MIYNFSSFFINAEEAEAFLELNLNLLETNVINIMLLLGLLIYGYKVSFSPSLVKRQEEIVQTIENAQKDVLNASSYYNLAENGFSQSLFWLQSWKAVYEKNKTDIVNTKYNQVRSGLLETFTTTENLITNFEKKAFLSLQRYIIFLTASRILRKFLVLTETEQSKLIEITISKLRGSKK